MKYRAGDSFTNLLLILWLWLSACGSGTQPVEVEECLELLVKYGLHQCSLSPSPLQICSAASI